MFLEAKWGGREKGNFFYLDEKLSLKADKPQVGQWPEDEEQKREILPYYFFNQIDKI